MAACVRYVRAMRAAFALPALFVLACGSKTAAPAAGKDAMIADAAAAATDGPATDAPAIEATATAAAAAAAAGAVGTSGYPGLDWGASLDALKAAFPKAAPGSDNLSIVGQYEGRAAITTFELKGGQLARISVSFEDSFPSMDACGKTWTAMRTALDPKLGKSVGDNLAATWESATYAVTLSCDPGDEDEGVLSLSYARPSPSE